jgi:hypothetical protein
MKKMDELLYEIELYQEMNELEIEIEQWED